MTHTGCGHPIRKDDDSDVIKMRLRFQLSKAQSTFDEFCYIQRINTHFYSIFMQRKIPNVFLKSACSYVLTQKLKTPRSVYRSYDIFIYS